jgi:hypothetical protein
LEKVRIEERHLDECALYRQATDISFNSSLVSKMRCEFLSSSDSIDVFQRTKHDVLNPCLNSRAGQFFTKVEFKCCRRLSTVRISLEDLVCNTIIDGHRSRASFRQPGVSEIVSQNPELVPQLIDDEIEAFDRPTHFVHQHQNAVALSRQDVTQGNAVDLNPYGLRDVPALHADYLQ